MKIVLPEKVQSMLYGIVGGGTKFFLDIPRPVSRSEKIVDACIIALLSAMCGLAGRDLYSWLKKRATKNKDI